MIKLVVSDIDGTIVGKDEILHDEMIDFAKQLKQEGIYYTVATGRVESLVQEYVKKMEIEIPYIACNGGTIVQGDTIIERNTIPLVMLRDLMEQADAMGMSLLYSMNGIEYAYRLTAYVKQQQEEYQRYLQPRGFTEADWETLRLDKLIVMAAVRDGSIGVIEKLCKQLPEEYRYKRYADKAIDILHSASTKEDGVARLAKRMGIRMNEVLFAGDDLNDIEIMKSAGIGVAVGNAQAAAKAAADYVARQECYKGVIEGVKWFIKIGEGNGKI